VGKSELCRSSFVPALASEFLIIGDQSRGQSTFLKRSKAWQSCFRDPNSIVLCEHHRNGPMEGINRSGRSMAFPLDDRHLDPFWARFFEAVQYDVNER